MPCNCATSSSASAASGVAQATCCTLLTHQLILECLLCPWSTVPLCTCLALQTLGLANPWAEQVWVLSAVRPDSPVIVWQAHPPESGVCWGGSSGASCHVSRHSHEQQHMAGDSRHGGTSCGSYFSSSSRTCLTSP